MTDKPKKPPDWSNQVWAEYRRWHDSLPEDIEMEGSRHAVIIGKLSQIKDGVLD